MIFPLLAISSPHKFNPFWGKTRRWECFITFLATFSSSFIGILVYEGDLCKFAWNSSTYFDFWCHFLGFFDIFRGFFRFSCEMPNPHCQFLLLFLKFWCFIWWRAQLCFWTEDWRHSGKSVKVQNFTKIEAKITCRGLKFWEWSLEISFSNLAFLDFKEKALEKVLEVANSGFRNKYQIQIIK